MNPNAKVFVSKSMNSHKRNQSSSDPKIPKQLNPNAKVFVHKQQSAIKHAHKSLQNSVGQRIQKCSKDKRTYVTLNTPPVFQSRLEEYVILRLCCLLWYKNAEIRALIGMCESNYRLKNHLYFLSNRKTKINVSFIEIPPSLLFESTFVNNQIESGVFRWDLSFVKDEGIKTLFCIGIVSSPLVEKCSHLGKDEGACSFSLYMFIKELGVGLRGVDDSVDFPHHTVGITKRSLVSVEVDANARTLSFFLNGEKIPFIISHIHVPLYIGASGVEWTFFQSLSFYRLPSVTPSPIVCRSYRCLEISRT